MIIQTYTQYVKILRLVLPAVAGLSLLTLLIWPWWHERQQLSVKKPTNAASVQPVRSSAPLQVLKPDYQGLDQSGRAYHITASRVEQGLDPKEPLLLIEPIASLNMDKNQDNTANNALNAPGAKPPITLKALRGLYDMQAQTIDLKGEIKLDYAGYQLQSDDLAIDVTGGAITTSSAVTGQGPRGNLSAQRLTIADKGAIIVLKGPSRLVLMPQANPPEASPHDVLQPSPKTTAP